MQQNDNVNRYNQYILGSDLFSEGQLILFIYIYIRLSDSIVTKIQTILTKSNYLTRANHNFI